MEIKRSGSQPSNKGPADWFTGTVRIDPLFQPQAPARTAAAIVGMLLLAYIGFRIYKSRETIYNFQCTADV